MSSKPVVIGGKLKFKGNSSNKNSSNIIPKVTSSSSSSSTTTTTTTSSSTTRISKDSNKRSREDEEDLSHLTESEKRFRMSKIEKEKKDIKKLVKQTYRDRLKEFNEKLSKQSDHNDIPRVSAAGNG